MNKTIIHGAVLSKDSGWKIFYLGKCGVMQKGGHVLYLTEKRTNKQYWNISIATITVGHIHYLGSHVDVCFCRAGVLFGFTGSVVHH